MGSCNFGSLKNSLVQINPKLNSKPYDYLYKATDSNKINLSKNKRSISKFSQRATILRETVSDP